MLIFKSEMSKCKLVDILSITLKMNYYIKRKYFDFCLTASIFALHISFKIKKNFLNYNREQ